MCGSKSGRVVPPHPAFGHLLPRWGEGTCGCHLSRSGRGRPGPAGGSRAGEGCARLTASLAACLAEWRPLIRPSATSSRVGEKGRAAVTSPVPGEVARVPRAGAGRVRAARVWQHVWQQVWQSGARSSGLRPPAPTLGRRDVVRRRSAAGLDESGSGELPSIASVHLRRPANLQNGAV